MRGTPGLPDPVSNSEPVQYNVADLVYVGLRGHVAALDRRTGDLVWRWKAPKGNSYGTVLVDGDCVLAGVYGYVYCLDALTGVQLWTNPMRGFGTGVTSLATQRGSSTVNQQAGAAEAAAQAAAAAT